MKLNNLLKSIFVFAIIGVLFAGCGNKNIQITTDVDDVDTVADTTTSTDDIQVETDDAQVTTPEQQTDEIITSVDDTQIEDDIELGELI